MAGNYWIKFYVEILDDPKMATLPDRLWRRFYELCLIAGRMNKEGDLPNDKQIAWTLRMSEDEIKNDLDGLQDAGLIAKTQGGWNVTNFKKRQSKLEPSEKMQRYRDERKRSHYYGDDETEPVTEALPSVTQITDNRLTDNRTEADADDLNSDIRTFCSITHLPVPRSKETITTWSNDLAALKVRGADERVIRKACQELTEKGTFKITSPKSIIKACEVVMAEGKRKGDSGYIPISASSQFSDVVNR